MKRVYFLPTAQHDEDNPWLPNARGIARINAIMAPLKEDPEGDLVIGGGYANHVGITYADRTALYVANNHPWAIPQLRAVSGMHNRTVQDLFFGILSYLSFMEGRGTAVVPAEAELVFASERPHYLRSENAIRALGFTPHHVESGSDLSLYSEADLQIVQENDLGKLFGLGDTAVQWNEKAAEAAATQALFCKEWSVRNPNLDADFRAQIRLLLLGLSERGVLIQSPALPTVRPLLKIPALTASINLAV